MSSLPFIDQVDGLLAAKDDKKLKALLMRHRPQEIAQVINRLPNGKRKTFALLPPEMQADTMVQLSEQNKEFVMPRLSDMTIARFVHFNEEDDAADILQFLPDVRRKTILSHLKPQKKAKIEKLLTFNPETAGGLMDLNFITVNPTMTLREVSELVRAHVAEQRQTPMVVVMDSKGKSQGFIPYKSLMLAPGTKTVDQVMHHLHIFPHHTDQEKVVRVAMREKGEVFGVVDENEQFIGVVHLRDLLKIAQMEATEDVLKFAGVSPEEELLGPASTAIRMRYKWLVINLATAFLASSVVHLFEGTIAQLAVLAAYMPIVAGMGGNAGTQTLAVAVRGLALGDVNARQRVHLITKEMMTGFSNGIVTGTIAAAIIYISGGNPAIGLILGISMMINMVVAGIAGAVIPLTLRALKIDPAVASAVFVTTATDVFGFFTFLGLATVFLL